MTRYIVKAKGAGDAAALDRATAADGVELVDRIGDAAALVEASEEAVEALKAALPGWTVAPESGRIARPAPPFPRPGWKLG